MAVISCFPQRRELYATIRSYLGQDLSVLRWKCSAHHVLYTCTIIALIMVDIVFSSCDLLSTNLLSVGYYLFSSVAQNSSGTAVQSTCKE